MNFAETSRRQIPPQQGLIVAQYTIEDGPTWLEQRWRGTPQLHGVVSLTVKVYDDGSTEFLVFEKRIKKDGTPYDEAPRRMYAWGGANSPKAAQAEVVEAFRKTHEYLLS